MSELTIIEILKLIDEADSEKRKIKLLKKNDNFILRTILQGNFSEQIKFDMPKGSPPLEETKEEEIVSLDDEIIKQICKSCDKRQHQWRREIVFTKAIFPAEVPLCAFSINTCGQSAVSLKKFVVFAVKKA